MGRGWKIAKEADDRRKVAMPQQNYYYWDKYFVGIIEIEHAIWEIEIIVRVILFVVGARNSSRLTSFRCTILWFLKKKEKQNILLETMANVSTDIEKCFPYVPIDRRTNIISKSKVRIVKKNVKNC